MPRRKKDDPIKYTPETQGALAIADLTKEVKQEAMLAHSLMGRSVREIAAMFEMAPSTAHRWLTEARRNEQLLKAKGIVGERLVPKALAVYDKKLEEGDLEAARDVLFGAGVLLKNATLQVKTGEDPLERFRQKYFGEEVVEGETVKGDAGS